MTAQQNTSISSDAPTYFLNPENVHQPANRLSNLDACVTRPPKKPDPLAASYVLPGGASMLKALENPAPHGKYIKVKFEKQVCNIFRFHSLFMAVIVL